jgi:nucleoside-diphosphate-sugar epimerase
MIGVMREKFPGIEVKYNPRDNLMPERGTLSIEKARRLLGYEPAYPLERGFAEYIAWYKELARQQPQFFKATNSAN